MDVLDRVRAAFLVDPNVISVEVVGSRLSGTDNPLSDWDIRIESHDQDALVDALPALTAALGPLAAQWDRLSDHAVYMLMLPGGIKVDLFPGDRPWQMSPPWKPGPETLTAIDAHFWDWIVWLGAKTLGGKSDVVAVELEKLRVNLLGPLGAESTAASVADAVAQYLQLRDAAERRFGVTVAPSLSDDVLARLRDEGLI